MLFVSPEICSISTRLLRWYLLSVIAVVSEAIHAIDLVLVAVGLRLRCVVVTALLCVGSLEGDLSTARHKGFCFG